MKLLLALLPLLAIIAISGCTGTTPATGDNGDTGTTSTGEIREFDMTARQWEFEPDTITVNKGDTVKLHIKSVDVTHGFSLPDFGINVNLVPGEDTHVEFVADKTGTFSFACSVYCGTGHGGMVGTLIVE
jgi:cytochrome c oxidase subunit 2